MATEAGEMEIGTMVDGAETSSAEDDRPLHDATNTVDGKTHTTGTEVTPTQVGMTRSAGSDHVRLTTTADRTLIGTEVPAPTDVVVRGLQVISSIFLGATVTTSLMFRSL